MSFQPSSQRLRPAVRRRVRMGLQTRSLSATMGVLVAMGCLVGCDPVIEEFPPDRLHAAVVGYSEDLQQATITGLQSDVHQVVESLFGTPTQPIWPTELADSRLVINPENLKRSAGPVLQLKDNTHLGLYREHCVTCHGIDGAGNGPASAFQNPYPRNFHPGIFKWKSTERSARPTRDDLMRTLVQGIPGSGMPSFALIDQRDREALVDYTIYLSVRGEVQRRLMDVAIWELGYGEDDAVRFVSTAPQDSDGDVSDIIDEVVFDVTKRWADAAASVVTVPEGLFDSPPEGEALVAAIQRGKDLFHGRVANCVGCHGQGGLGGVVTLDYDEWTKHYTTRLGINPQDRDAVRPMRTAGAPRPRLAQPRHFGDGKFHGGGDVATLYRRLTQGIAGTPMPGVMVKLKDENGGLRPEEIADLVWYLRSVFEVES